MATLVLEKHTAAGGSDVRRTSRGPRLARQIERSYFSVCVAHRKGGVGKTTTTWYLSRELARAGKNVVLRDLDPQRGLSDIIRDLGGQDGVFSRRLALVADGQSLPFAPDIELIDTPPSLDESLPGLNRADAVIIPAVPEHQAVRALERMLRVLDDSRRDHPFLLPLGILPVRVRPRWKLHQEFLASIESLAEEFGYPMLPAIPESQDVLRYSLRGGIGNQWRIRSLPQWPCMTGLAIVAGRSTTLKTQSHQRRLDRGELGEVSTQVERARHPAKAVAYLSLDLVDPSPEARNSRQRYDEASINELATSIQEHGVLQPILVSPKGDGRYDTIFGNRRLLASRRAGNAEIPAVVRDGVTEREKFVWNLVENIQRQGLSSKERADSIRALADSGGGVREICRWTGKDPGTISRWLRIGTKPEVMQALEDGRIDIARAQYLAPVQDEEELSSLIEQAPTLSMTEFAQLAKSVVINNSAYSIDDGRLADVDRKLAKIRVITVVGLAHLDRILARVLELRSQAQSDTNVLSASQSADHEVEKSADPRTNRARPRRGKTAVPPAETRSHRRAATHKS